MTGTCKAKGKGWACDRDAATKGLCNSHNMQKHRGMDLAPLRMRRAEQAVRLTISLSRSEKEALGEHPASRAAQLVRSALKVTGTGSKR